MRARLSRLDYRMGDRTYQLVSVIGSGALAVTAAAFCAHILALAITGHPGVLIVLLIPLPVALVMGLVCRDGVLALRRTRGEGRTVGCPRKPVSPK